MTNYLLNILGIVIMGVLIEIITPNGKNVKIYKKYIFNICGVCFNITFVNYFFKYKYHQIF